MEKRRDEQPARIVIDTCAGVSSKEYELILDSAIGEGELVHLALFAESKPINLEKAMEDPIRMQERNQTCHCNF